MKIEILSSNGGANNIGFIIDETGYITETRGEFLKDTGDDVIIRFDLAEYLTRHPFTEDDEGNESGHRAAIDILSIGYWMADGRYEPYEQSFEDFAEDSRDWCRRRLDDGKTITLNANQFNTIMDALYAAHDVVLATGSDNEEPTKSGADIFDMVCNIGIAVGEAMDVVDELLPAKENTSA